MAQADPAAGGSICGCPWYGSIPYLSGDEWEGPTADSRSPLEGLSPLQRAALLKRAKANVDDRYACVGILPEIGAFVERLEGLLPSFFEGAAALLPALGRRNSGHEEPGYVAPDAAASARILQSRAADAEMYAHVKRRWEERHAPCVR